MTTVQVQTTAVRVVLDASDQVVLVAPSGSNPEIGDLSSLATSAQGNVVAAVNEIHAELEALEIGGGGVLPSVWDANSLVKADTDNTPVALSVGVNTLVGRLSGAIASLTPTQVRALLNLEVGADVQAYSATLDATTAAFTTALAAKLAGIADDATDDTTVDAHIADASAAHAASAISVVAQGGIAATDVQAALEELQSEIGAGGGTVTSVATKTGDVVLEVADLSDSTALGRTLMAIADAAAGRVALGLDSIALDATNDDTVTAHIADASSAHAASAVSVVAQGGIAATDVQAALEELQGEIPPAAPVDSVNGQTGDVVLSAGDVGATDDTAVAAHIADASSAHAASAISVVAQGGIAATDVQAALEEIQGEIPPAAPVDSVNGQTGTVVITAAGLGVEPGATGDQAPAEILAALLGVDGTGSGLDADLLDGLEAAAFALAGHDHDGDYAALGHNHDATYAPLGHNHDGTYAPYGGTTTRSGSFQLTAADDGNYDYVSSVSAVTVTCPGTTQEDLGQGFTYSILAGTGGVTIAAGTGVTFQWSPNLSVAEGETITVRKAAGNVWLVAGGTS